MFLLRYYTIFSKNIQTSTVMNVGL